MALHADVALRTAPHLFWLFIFTGAHRHADDERQQGHHDRLEQGLEQGTKSAMDTVKNAVDKITSNPVLNNISRIQAVDSAVEGLGNSMQSAKMAEVNGHQLEAQKAEVRADDAQAMIENEARIVQVIYDHINKAIDTAIKGQANQHSAKLKLMGAGKL